MKKPASVVTTLVIFGFLIALGILTTLKNKPNEVGLLLASLAMPILFLIGWVGIFLRKNWARIYGSVLVVLVAVLINALPFMVSGAQPVTSVSLVFNLVLTLLFGWWAYSLLLGKASRFHFQGEPSA